MSVGGGGKRRWARTKSPNECEFAGGGPGSTERGEPGCACLGATRQAERAQSRGGDGEPRCRIKGGEPGCAPGEAMDPRCKGSAPRAGPCEQVALGRLRARTARRRAGSARSRTCRGPGRTLRVWAQRFLFRPSAVHSEAEDMTTTTSSKWRSAETQRPARMWWVSRDAGPAANSGNQCPCGTPAPRETAVPTFNEAAENLARPKSKAAAASGDVARLPLSAVGLVRDPCDCAMLPHIRV
jgi:hypothetical protein